MNRKTVIQVSVVVVAFSASGIVLYRGFAKPKAPLPAVPLTMQYPMAGGATTSAGSVLAGGGPKSIDKVLPNGNTLNFGVLGKQNLQYGLVEYPAVNLNSEVGL